MNKYMGFYELKEINIPTIPWEKFTLESCLNNDLLWTLRVAVENNNDLNLPRVVGASSQEAYEKGKDLLTKFGENGIVVYYPYFIAEKSGVLDISNDSIVIEAVDKDLWNLVSYGKKDVTIILSKDSSEYIGNEKFLTNSEIDLLLKYANVIRYKYRDIMAEGKSVFAEWSFAFNTNINHEPYGEKYLVFYELRSVR